VGASKPGGERVSIKKDSGRQKQVPWIKHNREKSFVEPKDWEP
jgi:hypothetical protein